MLFFRAPGARIEHMVVNRQAATTLCGKPAIGAKWSLAERGVDPRIRPLCDTCRQLAR